MAVTVVADDPTHAEIATKHLFLGGGDEIDATARARRSAALWVTTEGEIATSPAFGSYTVWRAG